MKSIAVHVRVRFKCFARTFILPHTHTHTQVEFSFGVIADPQYAAAEDCLNFTQTRMRYYRNALQVTKAAVDAWNETHEQEGPRTFEYNGKPVSFVMELGDAIDGKASTDSREFETYGELNAVFDGCKTQHVYHTVGNHELYNFTRRELCDARVWGSGPTVDAVRATADAKVDQVREQMQ